MLSRRRGSKKRWYHFPYILVCWNAALRWRCDSASRSGRPCQACRWRLQGAPQLDSPLICPQSALGPPVAAGLSALIRGGLGPAHTQTPAHSSLPFGSLHSHSTSIPRAGRCWNVDTSSYWPRPLPPQLPPFRTSAPRTSTSNHLDHPLPYLQGPKLRRAIFCSRAFTNASSGWPRWASLREIAESQRLPGWLAGGQWIDTPSYHRALTDRCYERCRMHMSMDKAFDIRSGLGDTDAIGSWTVGRYEEHSGCLRHAICQAVLDFNSSLDSKCTSIEYL